jgi:hypothetical protein
MNLNWTAVLFFVLAIILVAQSSITIFTYNKNKTTKDLNYYWSVAVLVVAICGLIASGIMITKPSGGAPAAVSKALADQGDLLAPVDVATLTAKGTPENVETLLSTIQTTGAQVKTKVDQEIEVKQRALQALLETIEQRIQNTARATAALSSTAKTA